MLQCVNRGESRGTCRRTIAAATHQRVRTAALPPDICALTIALSRCGKPIHLDLSARLLGQAYRVSIRGPLPIVLRERGLKVPCFDGRSPTDGENSTSPVIKSGVSNFLCTLTFPGRAPHCLARTPPHQRRLSSSLRLHSIEPRRLGSIPNFGSRSAAATLPFPSARHQSALSGAHICERDLHVPSANNIGRLCLGHGNALRDQTKNEYEGYSHIVR